MDSLEKAFEKQTRLLLEQKELLEDCNRLLREQSEILEDVNEFNEE